MIIKPLPQNRGFFPRGLVRGSAPLSLHAAFLLAAALLLSASFTSAQASNLNLQSRGQSSVLQLASIPRPVNSSRRRSIPRPGQVPLHTAYTWGVLFMDGNLVDKNPQAAIYWLLEAARQGHVDAQYRLALLVRSYGKILHAADPVVWASRAANQGHARAQKLFADMQLRGKGIARSPMDAYIWYTLARRGGVDTSLQLHRLEQRLTPAKIAKAQQTADVIQNAIQNRRDRAYVWGVTGSTLFLEPNFDYAF